MTDLAANLVRRGPTTGLAVIAAVVALTGGEMGRALARAGAVMALLAAGAYAVRRLRDRAKAPGPAHALVVAERCPLARDAGLALVHAGRRQLVVGYGPAGVSLVAEVTDDGAGTTR